jgi:nicotinate-nucleotide pyrophosphorylase (carboxylating)
MNRRELLTRGFTRLRGLELTNPEYLKWVKRFTMDVLEQDLGKRGDITTQLLFDDQTYPAKAVVRVKEDGVLAGIEEVTWFLQQKGIEVTPHIKDGERVHTGDSVLELRGSERDLLETERACLKVLQRMSGIASTTRRMVDKIVDAGLDTMVVATRKTHWPLLDKKAVYLGRGGTHRLGLWEAILIKDNHLEELKREGYTETYIEEALTRVWDQRSTVAFIEIEVETEEDACTAAEAFKRRQQQGEGIPCIVMLDNMSPKQIKRVIDELKTRDVYDQVLLEASGGINQTSILDYAKTGVDAVSLGALTHSPHALDMNQTLLR